MMRRRFPVLCVLCCAAAFAAAVGCRRSDNQAAAVDTTSGATSAAAATAASASAPLNLADIAGKWNVRSVPESGADTTPTRYVLTTTANTTGWTITFPNRKEPVPVHVATVAGDSVVLHAGPFESVRRKGVQVTTESVAHFREGKLVGTTVAHYKTTGPDSVLRLRTEGTRAP